MSFWDSLETQLKALGSFFVFFVLHYFLMGLAFGLTKYNSLLPLFFSIFIGFTFAVVMLIWYIREVDKETFILKGIDRQTWIWVLLLFLSQYMFTMAFYGYPGWIAKYEINSGTIVLIIIGVVAAPIIEEILFRGLLQKQLFKKRPWLSILITSIVFSMMHYKNISGTLLTFLLGFFCGFIYYKTNKLILSIIFHSLHNFMCSVFLFSFTYVPLLQLGSFILAVVIAVYAICGFMKGKTLKAINKK